MTCFHFLPTFWKIFQIVGNVTGWLCQLWKIINKYCVKNLEETMLNLLTSAIFQNPKPKFWLYSHLSLVNRPVKNAYHTFT